MNIVQIGNFGAFHSSENHYLETLRDLGHHVAPINEDDLFGWQRLVERLKAGDVEDLAIIWTRTRSLSERIPIELRYEMLIAAYEASVVTYALHLDRWWGLNRQHDVYTDPYFHCQRVMTADGHHIAEWSALGIDHSWWPPGILERYVERSEPRNEYKADIAFVGTRTGYHAEWNHREDLVKHLIKKWGSKVTLWPGAHGQIRGDHLGNLYASTKIIIGDSCRAPARDGSPMTRYYSDRIPETIGRGGFLIHPRVSGVTEGEHYTEGEHLACWTHGDWDELDEVIGKYLYEPEARREISEAGMKHVGEHHTYTKRFQELLG
jgi:hypothetical protein